MSFRGSFFALIVMGSSIGGALLAAGPERAETPRPVIDITLAMLERLRDCGEQGKRSIWGGIQCGRFDHTLSSRMLKALADEPWQRVELFEGTRSFRAEDLNSRAEFRWMRNELRDGQDLSIFSVWLPQIKLTVACATAERGREKEIKSCHMDGFEWPMTIPELFCVGISPLYKTFHVQILRNRSNDRLAEQVYEVDSAALIRNEEMRDRWEKTTETDSEPARVPVLKRWNSDDGRVRYVGEEFRLEVREHNPWDPIRAPGLLTSHSTLGSLRLDCEWQD